MVCRVVLTWPLALRLTHPFGPPRGQLESGKHLDWTSGHWSVRRQAEGTENPRITRAWCFVSYSQWSTQVGDKLDNTFLVVKALVNGPRASTFIRRFQRQVHACVVSYTICVRQWRYIDMD